MKKRVSDLYIFLRTGIGEYWYCCGIYSDGAGQGYIIGANV